MTVPRKWSLFQLRQLWNPQKSENMTKGVHRIRRISPRTPDALGANCPCNSTLLFGSRERDTRTDRDILASLDSSLATDGSFILSPYFPPLSPPYGASCITAAFANSGIAQRMTSTTSTTLLNYSRQKMPPKKKKKKMWKTGAPPKRPPHSLVLKDASNERSGRREVREADICEGYIQKGGKGNGAAEN